MSQTPGYWTVLLLVFAVAVCGCEKKPTQAGPKPPGNAYATNSIGMKLKRIPPGSFQRDLEEGTDEKRLVEVRIAHSFDIGVFEVTQAQYQQIMGVNPSHFTGPNLPVDSVLWFDAQEFCRRLSKKEGVTYRLPTEAEWEYACRAGSTTEYYWGDKYRTRYAWCEVNSEERTHEVGTREPNAWGLYDMSGNLWEWCADWYAEYPSVAVVDPIGPASGSERVLRGGAWNSYEWYVSSVVRHRNVPSTRLDIYGFRVCRTVTPGQP